MKLKKLLSLCLTTKFTVVGDYNGVIKFSWQISHELEHAKFSTFEICNNYTQLPEEILNRKVRRIYVNNSEMLIHVKGEKKNA